MLYWMSVVTFLLTWTNFKSFKERILFGVDSQQYFGLVVAKKPLVINLMLCYGRRQKLITFVTFNFWEYFFFTPIPCTYTSLPLDGMARNYFFIYMDMQDHTINRLWIHFVPTSLYLRRRKTFGLSWNWNPGPLASEVTALTTRPWLLGNV